MKKDLKYYLNLPYTIRIFKYIEYNGKEYFGAEIPELPGCGAEGRTREEALTKLQEAKRAWIEVSLERGLEIPEPKDNIKLVRGGFKDEDCIKIKAR